MTEFSLFEGDALNRFFNLFGIRTKGVWNQVARFLFVIALTFLPPALFSLLDGFGPGNPRALNFFGDFGSLCMGFVGYPLFILAEVIISDKTRATANHFQRSGLIGKDHLPELEKLNEKMARLRQSLWPDVVCLAVAYLCSLFWVWEETHNAYNTWHAIGAPGVQWPTRAGWWLTLVSIPVFNYWWLRWIWKVSLWCIYLKKVSKLDLRLIASHPDLTGGLAFLSAAQASFAIVIFAFGLGILAPMLSYKIEIENASLWTFSLGGPLIGFIIGTPLLFTVPLFFFTKRLSRVKKRAIDLYQDRATEAAIMFEQQWLTPCHADNCEILMGGTVSAMNHLNTAYNHIQKMRVVPFDITSFSQLTASTLGSLIPLLPKVLSLPEPTTKVLDLIKSLMGG